MWNWFCYYEFVSRINEGNEMVEKRTEHSWVSKDEDGEPVFTVDLCGYDINVKLLNLDTLEDLKDFHQALGEAIEIAEAQDAHIP
jgi:hypothetical protein